MTHNQTESSGLAAYADQVLAGTGLTESDVTGAGTPPEGSAAHALREGWRVAERAATIKGGLTR